MNLEGLLFLVLWGSIFLVSVTVHEFCHGYLANRLGDRTALEAGRLTLNPLKHLDPFWTVLLPALLYISTRGAFMIGMARPVPVNFLNLKRPKQDMIWVALAGPLANFLLAGAIALVYRLFQFKFLLYAIYFNLGLGVFNLVPIPPLDGSRILTGLLPMSLAVRYVRLERVGFLLVLGLYFMGVLHWILVPSINFFSGLLGVPKLQF